MKPHKLNRPATCMGSGLVTLDVVLNGDLQTVPRNWVGGSCGNVLTILSYLGWQSYPVTNLGHDEAAENILKDWNQFGVSQRFVDKDINRSTPIIIEQIKSNASGCLTHKYYWECPNCGMRFPRYTPIPLTKVKRVLGEFPDIDCFYFDRVSPGTLALAEEAKRVGAIVFFEPPNLRNVSSFDRAIKISDIVKVACKHFHEGGLLETTKGPSLLIQTLGAEGMMYKLGKEHKSWKHIPAFAIKEFRDAAGAGDWCSAGILFTLCNKVHSGLASFSENEIVKALNLGQAMAALNCSFEGARGGMYAMSKDQFDSSVDQILRKQVVEGTYQKEMSEEVSNIFTRLCPGCSAK